MTKLITLIGVLAMITCDAIEKPSEPLYELCPYDLYFRVLYVQDRFDFIDCLIREARRNPEYAIHAIDIIDETLGQCKDALGIDKYRE